MSLVSGKTPSFSFLFEADGVSRQAAAGWVVHLFKNACVCKPLWIVGHHFVHDEHTDRRIDCMSRRDHVSRDRCCGFYRVHVPRCMYDYVYRCVFFFFAVYRFTVLACLSAPL